jgi:hypothetical protein
MRHAAKATLPGHSAISGFRYAGIVLIAAAIAGSFVSPARAQSIDYGMLEQLFGEAITASGLTAFLYQRDRETIALARPDLAVAGTG